MRVIAGKAKGRALVAPEGFDTRPITAMMKEGKNIYSRKNALEAIWFLSW